MTERERSQLAETARFYTAHREEHRPVRKRAPRAYIFAAAAGFAFLYAVSMDKDMSAKFITAAAQMSEASAMIELMNRDAFCRMKTPDSSSHDVATNTDIASDIYADDIHMLSYGNKRMPSSHNEEADIPEALPLPIPDTATPLPYPSDISDNDGNIKRITYQKGNGENYIDLPLGGQLRNVTDLSSDEIYKNATLSPDFSIELDAPADKPQILIMHTHTTESYEPYEREFYDSDFLCRTTDGSMNVTAVGEKMTEIFEKNGIRTLHDTTIHDHPSYNGSYDRSRETVKAILEKYPSIKVILDVHRDAIEKEDGERIAPYAEINGRSCAQVMLICGCDDGTMNMPDCMKNLRTASLFEQYMENIYPGLTRPVLYDHRHYNQDLTTGSLLLEVGGHANSIDEAIYAGELAAEAISLALTNS